MVTKSLVNSLRTAEETITRPSSSTRSHRQPQEDRSWPWCPSSMFNPESCLWRVHTSSQEEVEAVILAINQKRRNIFIFGSEPRFKNRDVDIQGERPGGRPKERMALKDAAAAIGRNISKKETYEHHCLTRQPSDRPFQ
ncbi:unnamed protein product [Caenorhabditis nigoni]